MRRRNQRGCLRCTRRKTGPSCWEFLWRENDADGNRTRRTAVIGTVEQFPTRDLAQVAVDGLRMSINQNRNRQREQSIAVADLVDHYVETELPDELIGTLTQRGLSTASFSSDGYDPTGAVGIRDVRTAAVERRLKQLSRVNVERRHWRPPLTWQGTLRNSYWTQISTIVTSRRAPDSGMLQN
jgi:hypothetical protein